MQLATIAGDTAPRPAIVDRRGVLPLDVIGVHHPAGLRGLITDGLPADLAGRVARTDQRQFLAPADVRFLAPYRDQTKIMGVGLNYVDHASDLAQAIPDRPAIFLKAAHTVIGPGDAIELPAMSSRVTAEAELGLVVSRGGRDIPEADALEHVFGVTPILDQTAEDILEVNPRFLTVSKNFPTFFSFGPTVTTLDEFLAGRAIGEVEVTTRVGERTRRNVVGNMTFSPARIVSYISAVMPLCPGDVIATGTPGALVVDVGDAAECRVDGLPVLVNPVARTR
jgi:2-keto-4-pentenoate hydratase/2-oxohepta-3-ene-1,7-dioic acid hydratase in catechol pathway